MRKKRSINLTAKRGEKVTVSYLVLSRGKKGERCSEKEGHYFFPSYKEEKGAVFFKEKEKRKKGNTKKKNLLP